MDNSQLHAVEYIITVLSAVLLYLRFAPLAGNLRVLIYAIQAGLFVAQMYAVYKKQNQAKKKDIVSPKVFVAEVAQHYLETHPEGRMIAKKSDVDEKVEKLLSDEEAAGLG